MYKNDLQGNETQCISNKVAIKDKGTKNRDSKKKFCVWASLIVIRAMIKCNVPLSV